MKQPWIMPVLPLLLAGCMAMPGAPPASAVPETGGDMDSAAKPAGGEAGVGDEVPQAAPVPVVRPDTPPVPAATPRLRPQPVSRTVDELMGLTPEQIEGLLGPPDSVRHDTPAITWRYVQEPCTLDFQFFQDIESGLFRALKYEAAGASADGCLARIERREEP